MVECEAVLSGERDSGEVGSDQDDAVVTADCEVDRRAGPEALTGVVEGVEVNVER